MHPRALRPSCVVCLGALGAVLTAGPATAAKAPSSAETLSLGLPFSSTVFDFYDRSLEWLRLPLPLLPGDRVQYAIQSDKSMRVCLAPATDDVGRLDREEECGVQNYPGSLVHEDTDPGLFRRVLSHSGQATSGFLLIATSTLPDRRVDATFTITLEKQVHLVRFGSLTATRSGSANRRLLAAPLRLTDNSAVADGHAGYIEVRYGQAKRKRAGSAVVRGGTLRGKFTLRRDGRPAKARLCTTRVGDAVKVCTRELRLAPPTR